MASKFKDANKILSTGSFCEVRLVKVRATQEILVQKTFKLSKMRNQAILGFARAHDDILKLLTLPSILKCHATFMPSPDEFAIVTEYCCESILLSEMIIKRMEAGPFDAVDVLKLAAQLLSAVNYLQKGIPKVTLVHGDIKPENIFLVGNKNIKLGQLETMAIYESTLLSSNFGGTVAYMPPERLEGKVKGKSDEWSIGVTLYEIATLKLPFGSGSLEETKKRIGKFTLTVPFIEITQKIVVPVIKSLLVVDVSKRNTAENALMQIPDYKNFLWKSKYEDYGQPLVPGAYGEVQPVKCRDTGEILIRKRIRRDPFSPDSFERYKREILTMEKMFHPHIVRYFEGFEDKIGYFLVMEYCKGGNLRDAMNKRLELSGFKPFERDRILLWGGQLMDALAYVHSKGIMHRDIKPENIFLSEERNLKLGDFGSAKEREHTCGGGNTYIGTSGYMAPEIERYRFSAGTEYDDVVDEWSAGILLFELATLKKPPTLSNSDFRQPTISAETSKRFSEEIASIENTDIRGLVEKLVVFDPRNRCKAREMLRIIENIRNPMPKPLPIAKIDPATKFQIETSVELISSDSTFGRTTWVKTPRTFIFKIRSAQQMTSFSDAQNRKMKEKLAQYGALSKMSSNKGIALIYDVFETPKKEFGFTMEYLSGRDLTRAISSRKKAKDFFSEEEILMAGKQILSGLHFLHCRDITHLGIRTSNIYFRKASPNSKSGDFAKVRIGAMDAAIQFMDLKTLKKNHLSKVAYLAPEILEQKNDAWKISADMWGFGCVLHELATLSRTFYGSSEGSLTRRIVEEDYSPIDDKKYSVYFINVVGKLLSTQPRQRKTAKELTIHNLFT